jgi:hypothetical protein
MRRHFGIGPIDLRIVKAGLDDGGLRIVRHKQLRDAADRRKRAPSTATKICAMRISSQRKG